MALVLLGREAPDSPALPGLALLSHTVRVLPPVAPSLAHLDGADVALVDARADLAVARGLCRLVSAELPVLAVVAEGGLVAVTAEWNVDDVILPTAGPAEIEARLRWVSARRGPVAAPEQGAVLMLGDLVIDEETYVARLRGRPLDLTYKEFELLKFLCAHPGRVFTRAQLVQEVWGYDFFGGTRTVDVHVRRLRAKLGSDHEALIGTVRNVGYKAVWPVERGAGHDADPG